MIYIFLYMQMQVSGHTIICLFTNWHYGPLIIAQDALVYPAAVIAQDAIVYPAAVIAKYALVYPTVIPQDASIPSRRRCSIRSDKHYRHIRVPS